MEDMLRVPRRAAGLLERDTGDAIVVMAENGEVLHTLQGTGQYIWKQVDGIRSEGDILSNLVAEYDVGPERASEDLRKFLKTLSENGLIFFGE